MSRNISEVLNACLQLQANKKPITTALVKTKLAQPLPLATILSGIQRFKSASSLKEISELAAGSEEKEALQSEVILSAETIQVMQSQLNQLQNQVTKLQAEVEELKSKKTQ